MKKVYLFPIIILSLILSISFAGCAKKEPISSQAFCDKMTQNGYTVNDIKEQYSEFEHIKEAYLAVDETQSYKIEFYVLSDNEKAAAMFETNKQDCEQNKGSSYFGNSYNVGNHGKYTNTYDGMYVLISRVNNTLIFVKTSEDYKTAVNEAVDALGY